MSDTQTEDVSMSALPKPMSLDHFLAWEERQEGRFEFDGIAIRAMTGGTGAHARIQSNLIIVLGRQLQGGPCFVLGSELKLRTETSIRYPDAMVICSGFNETATVNTAPTVVFEIISPSSAGIDLSPKNTEYRTLAALRRYVVLQQSAAAAEVFFRNDDNEWDHEFVAAGGELAMPEIAAKTPLLACYEGLAVAKQ